MNELAGTVDLTFITNTEQRNSFVKKIVKTRNYLTHYPSDLEGGSATGEELYTLTAKLQLVLEIFLLRELGFSLELIQKIIPRSKRYYWLSE